MSNNSQKVRYEIVFIGTIPHVVPTEDPSEGRSWEEVRNEMVAFYEDYVAYWKNQNEPKYYDLDR